MVVGWNLLQLLLYVLAGLAACAWLRELGLPRGPALVGGLAFAIAPYRVQQSVGHLLGPISVLLAVALWAVERSRRGSVWWLAVSAAALASIPLSGQVHLALGAIPFFLLYAFVRLRPSDVRAYRHHFAASVAVAAVAVGAGLLVRQTVIKGSTQAGGRSLDEVSQYSARWGDLLARHVDHARSEQFVFLGWATPLLALVGLGLLIAARRYGLAVALGLGALVPVILALGTQDAALLRALARIPAVPLPTRARAAAADRVPLRGRPRRVRRRAVPGGVGLRACDRSPVRRPPRARVREVRPGRAPGGARGRPGARAARLRPRDPLRQRLPLVRHGRSAAAAGRVLDDRSQGGQGNRAAPRAAQLRRLERRHERVSPPPRDRDGRAPLGPLPEEQRRSRPGAVRAARPAPPRLGADRGPRARSRPSAAAGPGGRSPSAPSRRTTGRCSARAGTATWAPAGT